MRLLLYCRVGKNRDTRRESPAGAGAACAAQWFLPGGFSRKAGPIKHQLVFEVPVKRIGAQKPVAAQKPMTYTDLLAAVLFI